MQNVNPIQRVAGAVLFFVFLLFFPGYVPPTEGIVNLHPANTNIADVDEVLVYPNAASFDEYFRRMNQAGRFSGSFLLAHRGNILAESAYGFAHRHPYTPIEPRTTTFQLASVSKPLASIAVLGLYEQGQIDLDKDLREYWPQFPYAGITPMMLLSHRSGLHDYTYFSELYWDGSKPLNNKDVLQLLVDHEPNINFPPDRRHHYSNVNYALLGCLVEKVTGTPFPDYVEKAIFHPLGITQSYVIKDHLDQPEYAATGYTGLTRPMAPWWMDAVSGSKSICMTPYELFLVDNALRDGILLKPETFEKAIYGWGQMRSANADYGLGWRLYDHHGIQVVYHTGWWRGFRSLYLKIPEIDATAIIFANTTHARLSVRDMTERIIRAVEAHPES